MGQLAFQKAWQGSLVGLLTAALGVGIGLGFLILYDDILGDTHRSMGVPRVLSVLFFVAYLLAPAGVAWGTARWWRLNTGFALGIVILVIWGLAYLWLYVLSAINACGGNYEPWLISGVNENCGD